MIRRSTWIVLIVFVAVLAGFIWVQKTNHNEVPEATATTVSQNLFDIQEPDLVGVTIQSADGKTLQLERSEQDEWRLVYPRVASADAARVQSALSSFLGVQILSSPDTLPGLEALNLKNADYKILLVSKNGSQMIVNVGKETPTGSGYYLLSSNQSQVVVANKLGLDALLDLLDDSPYAPTPTLENTSTQEDG